MKTLQATLPRVMKFEGGNKGVLNLGLRVKYVPAECYNTL